MSDTAIIDVIRKAAGTHGTDFATMVVAEVTAVNIASRACTCKPLSGSSSSAITNVQLMAAVDDGLLLVPAVSSTVIINYTPRNVPYIAMFSGIDQAFLLTLNGIQFQGGELGGLPVSPYLVERLNLIENAFNLLNTKVNALASTPVIPNLVPTQESDIENTSITQGV